MSEASVTEIACAAENAPTMTEQPRSVLDGLSLDTAIRLRWALRDIKAKRTKLSPVRPDDLRMLTELGFIEMHDEEPMLTSEGMRVIAHSIAPESERGNKRPCALPLVAEHYLGASQPSELERRNAHDRVALRNAFTGGYASS